MPVVTRYSVNERVEDDIRQHMGAVAVGEGLKALACSNIRFLFHGIQQFAVTVQSTGFVHFVGETVKKRILANNSILGIKHVRCKGAEDGKRIVFRPQ